MTIEEISQTLQTVANNQAQLTEAQTKAQTENEARQAELDEAFKRFTEAQTKARTESDARLAQLDEIVKQIAVAHKSLVELIRTHEERLDGHDLDLRATDEKFNALATAQIGLEDRQAKIEESFQLLVQLARIQEERIDGHDEALRQTNGKLDALIDAQIRLTERGNALTNDIATLNNRFVRVDERFDRMAELAETHNLQLSRLDVRFDRMAELAEARDQQLSRQDERFDRMAELAEAHDRQFSRLEALQAENSAQIKALVVAQASTDDLIRSLLDRNGAAQPRRKITGPAKKKATKKKKG